MPLDKSNWSDEQRKEWRALIKDSREGISADFDPIYKGINYLLIAHSSGFAATLAFLKDIKTTLPGVKLSGIIYLFAIGLIAAIISYSLAVLNQYIANLAVSEPFDYKSKEAKIYRILMFSFMCISASLLVYTIFTIVKVIGAGQV